MATKTATPVPTITDVKNATDTLGSQFSGLKEDIQNIASKVTSLTNNLTSDPTPAATASGGDGPDWKLYGMIALGVVVAYFIGKKLKLL